MSTFAITEGVVPSAQKIVVYGPEGIGKSTFAASFPNALFIDTEGSTKNLSVRRLPTPTSWDMLQEEIAYVIENPTVCDTLVIDTFDWAEQHCIKKICDSASKSGIEDFGYGKGYIYEKEEIARFLHRLEDVVNLGIHVVITAHAQMRKVEQPDQIGTYDHWELKLGQKTGSVISPLVKEWADLLLFANYATVVTAVDKDGNKHKAQGGRRVMYTTHTPWWDAKNRFGLRDELDFLYGEIAPYLIPRAQMGTAAGADYMLQKKAEQIEEADKLRRLNEILEEPPAPAEEHPAVISEPAPAPVPENKSPGIPKALADLMAADGIDESEIRHAVAEQGIYPEDTDIKDYDDQTINGLIIGMWSDFRDYVKSLRNNNDLPF